MVIEFTRHFLKDLDKINQTSVKREIAAIIEQVENAGSLSEIVTSKNLKVFLMHIESEVEIIELVFTLKTIPLNSPE